jgi:DNA-binding IclR family transcriptional regulator
MDEILQYLKKHGDKLDSEIAKATHLSLPITRQYLAELAAKGEVINYHSTRLIEGIKIEGMRYRLSVVTPPAASEGKAKVFEIS